MSQSKNVATVTLNPAIDQTVSVPNFAAGKVNRVKSVTSNPGGKGVNVASNLADYGFAVSVTGFLGDENPVLFERLFKHKSINDRFVRIAGSTRTGIKIINEIAQETTDINFPGQAPTQADIETLFQAVDQLAEANEWFVLAGSIPLGCPADIYGELVQLIKSKGKSVAVDTSGEGLRLALPSLPTLIKPNIDELQELVGRPLQTHAEVIHAAQHWIEEGIETVIVSMGADGAIFIEAGEVVLANPPQVTVKSTVGAGDAMVSGTVAGKAEGISLAECARLATAFSVNVISQVGSGISSLEAIEAIKREVVVEVLSEIGF
jgi:1-phosphofructokinase family hexose kinase